MGTKFDPKFPSLWDCEQIPRHSLNCAVHQSAHRSCWWACLKISYAKNWTLDGESKNAAHRRHCHANIKRINTNLYNTTLILGANSRRKGENIKVHTVFTVLAFQSYRKNTPGWVCESMHDCPGKQRQAQLEKISFKKSDSTSIKFYVEWKRKISLVLIFRIVKDNFPHGNFQFAFSARWWPWTIMHTLAHSPGGIFYGTLKC